MLAQFYCLRLVLLQYGFPESAITSMAITPDSSLWFGTYEGDVFSLSFQGELRQVHASNDEDVNAIVAAGDSLLVFTSGQGLSLIVDPSAKELQPQLGMEYRYIATDHIIFRETPYLLSSNVLFQINQELSSDDFACETLTDFEIVDSTLYVGSSCGLFTLSIDNKGKWILPTNRMDFKPVKGSELLEIASIKADDAGNIWIGSSKNGLYRYDGSVRKYANRNLADPRIIDIDIDNDQNIWVATRSGVSFLELDPSQEIVLNSTHFGVAEGIDSQINHIKCGVDHQIWLGSSNGLISLNPDGAFHNNASPALSLDGLRLNYNPIDWEALGYQVSSLPTNPVFEHNQNHLPFELHLQGFAIIARAFAGFTFDIDIRQEVHFNFNNPITLTGLAAPTFNIKGEAPRLISAGLGLGQAGKPIADRCESARIGGRI